MAKVQQTVALLDEKSPDLFFSLESNGKIDSMDFSNMRRLLYLYPTR